MKMIDYLNKYRKQLDSDKKLQSFYKELKNLENSMPNEATKIRLVDQFKKENEARLKKLMQDSVLNKIEDSEFSRERVKLELEFKLKPDEILKKSKQEHIDKINTLKAQIEIYIQSVIQRLKNEEQKSIAIKTPVKVEKKTEAKIDIVDSKFENIKFPQQVFHKIVATNVYTSPIKEELYTRNILDYISIYNNSIQQKIPFFNQRHILIKYGNEDEYKKAKDLAKLIFSKAILSMPPSLISTVSIDRDNGVLGFLGDFTFENRLKEINSKKFIATISEIKTKREQLNLLNEDDGIENWKNYIEKAGKIPYYLGIDFKFEEKTEIFEDEEFADLLKYGINLIIISDKSCSSNNSFYTIDVSKFNYTEKYEASIVKAIAERHNKVLNEQLYKNVYYGNLVDIEEIEDNWKSNNALESVKILYGLNSNFEPEYFNLSENSIVHLAIIGESGSGKGILLRTIINTLISQYSPLQLELFIFDLKNETAKFYKDSPHCSHLIVKPFENELYFDSFADSILDYVFSEMESRKKIVEDSQYSTLSQLINNDQSVKIKRLIIIIDECTNLFLVDEIKNRISEILNVCRSFLIHFVFVGQPQGNKISSLANISKKIELPTFDEKDKSIRKFNDKKDNTEIIAINTEITDNKDIITNKIVDKTNKLYPFSNPIVIKDEEELNYSEVHSNVKDTSILLGVKSNMHYTPVCLDSNIKIIAMLGSDKSKKENILRSILKSLDHYNIELGVFQEPTEQIPSFLSSFIVQNIKSIELNKKDTYKILFYFSNKISNSHIPTDITTKLQCHNLVVFINSGDSFNYGFCTTKIFLNQNLLPSNINSRKYSINKSSNCFFYDESNRSDNSKCFKFNTINMDQNINFDNIKPFNDIDILGTEDNTFEENHSPNRIKRIDIFE